MVSSIREKSALPKSKGIFIAVILLLGLYFLPKNNAYGKPGIEYAIKASLVLKFPSFITWPAESDPFSASKNLVLCISGKDQFGDIFKLAMEENIVQVKLTLKRLGNSNDFNSCHILYLSSLNKTDIKQILNQVRDLPILVIGEQPGLANQGAGINFLIVKNKVRFEINKPAINQCGLIVSSELLALAHRVLEEQ